MLPILTVSNGFVGILGGNLIASLLVGIPTAAYWHVGADRRGRLHVLLLPE
ncbi:hypothetical protein BH11GEM2_BH11GEM2_06960 [soil metagenome]